MRDSNQSRLFEFNLTKASISRTVAMIAAVLFSAGITWIARAHTQPVPLSLRTAGESLEVPVADSSVSQKENGASEAGAPTPDSHGTSRKVAGHAPSIVSQPSVGKSTGPQGPHEFKSTVRIFIHPDDIYPVVVAVRPGKVVISAENNTQRDVALVVEPLHSPGRAVARVPAAAQDRRNRQEYTLGAGEYVFYEESRPQRQGKLIVDAKFK